MPGKLIVFEGTDGSGKSTQFDLLCQALAREGRAFRRLIFPQYDQPSSALLKMYLAGEFGSSPSDVNAYAASCFYAVDRYASFQKVWGEDYRQGGLILADRYTTSNAVHQAAKLPAAEQEAFFGWLADFEYDKLGLPRPSLVLWLDMPTHLAVENLRRRERLTHTSGDIHEVDTDYLARCRGTAQAAARFYAWQRISCVTAEGGLRTPEDIHAQVYRAVEELLARP